MSNWLLFVFLGLLGIVLGGIALVYPGVVTQGVEFFVAWSFIFIGAFIAVAGLFSGSGSTIFLALLLGVLMVLTGIVLIKNPLEGLMVLTLVVSILFVAQGVAMMIGAFGEDIETSMRWLLVICAIASFILAYLVFANADIGLGVLLGVQLLIDGVAAVVFGFHLRSIRRLF